ncbi:MAG: hypothetical protein FWH52_00470 [Synergistaceae bacterium]|nr:hypothetical protein [Synergistaceae bacterium]
MEKQEFYNSLNKCVGCKVDIINKSGINKGIYSSSLMDIKDDLIGLAHPMYKSSWVQMTGLELILNIKNDSSLLEVPVISRGTTFEGELLILWVEPTGEANKVQRRNFVRIPCFLNASTCFLEIYSDIVDDEANQDFNREWVPVIINNMSLGGISAKIKQGSGDNLYIKGRYLLALDLGGGTMFLNLLLRNIFNDSDDNIPNGAFAFGGLSVFQERAIGNYVRQKELAGKQING